jgi:phenylacetate-CoA ligase
MHGIDPATIRTADEFRRLPQMDKESCLLRYPLPELCRGGSPDGCDLVSVSPPMDGFAFAAPQRLAGEDGRPQALFAPRAAWGRGAR